MKTLYFECNMGAAGDMLMAALLELHDDPEGFLRRLNGAGIPGVAVSAEPSVKCGITGTSVRVTVDGREEGCCHDEHHHHDHEHCRDGHHHPGHEHCHDEHHHPGHEHCRDEHHHHDHEHRRDGHHHNSYLGIERLVGQLNVSDGVKRDALAVYGIIAGAESHVHGVSVDRIHFHEVGEMDAVADIVGVCMLIEELSPDAIMSSPINAGSGHVRCAHGVLPVPAPATARILQDVPVYGDGVIKSELCTPTGAALLKHFAQKFCAMPVMSVGKIGYGMGKKDFERANCVRVYIGDCAGGVNHTEIIEYVTELSCNLDDMTPESISFAQELLLREGALDVWTAPIGMKKGRFGMMFSCLCRDDVKDKMVTLIFKHTTTIGIREIPFKRHVLQREQSEIQTSHGTVRIKTSHGYGVKKSKPEYEDIAKIAREKDLSIQDMLDDMKDVRC